MSRYVHEYAALYIFLENVTFKVCLSKYTVFKDGLHWVTSNQTEMLCQTIILTYRVTSFVLRSSFCAQFDWHLILISPVNYSYKVGQDNIIFITVFPIQSGTLLKTCLILWMHTYVCIWIDFGVCVNPPKLLQCSHLSQTASAYRW